MATPLIPTMISCCPGQRSTSRPPGLDLDWYQPLHENGNILSYPAPSNNTFTPPDLGTYGIPCPKWTPLIVLMASRPGNGRDDTGIGGVHQQYQRHDRPRLQ